MVAACGRRRPGQAGRQAGRDAALVPAGSRPFAPGAHSRDAAFIAAATQVVFFFAL